jgi:hypothetical protein
VRSKVALHVEELGGRGVGEEGAVDFRALARKMKRLGTGNTAKISCVCSTGIHDGILLREDLLREDL